MKELPGYPVQNYPFGSFLSWGGPVGRKWIVYDIVWIGCPRRTPWIMLRTPVCCRILSSSLTSVSIFLSAVTLLYLSQWLAPSLPPFIQHTLILEAWEPHIPISHCFLYSLHNPSQGAIIRRSLPEKCILFYLPWSWIIKILVLLGPDQNSPKNNAKSLINTSLTETRIHCKKSWRSSSTPASGDAWPIRPDVGKSFQHFWRQFYYKYISFLTEFYKCWTSSTELDCLKSNITWARSYVQ